MFLSDWKYKSSDIGHRALNKLIVLTAREIIDQVGSTMMLEVLKPVFRQSGWAFSQNMNKRFHIEGNGIDAIAFPYWAARRLAYGGMVKPLRIYERGALIEVMSCPMAGISPEYCLLTHTLGEGICECVNNEYEMVFTSHMTDGEAKCRVVAKKKQGSYKELNDLGELVQILKDVSMSDQERDELSTNMEGNFLIIFIETLIDFVGEQETVRLLEPKFKEVGNQIGKEMLSLAPKGITDDELLKWMIRTISLSMDRQIMRIDYDEGKYDYIASECFFVHGKRTVCDLLEAFIESLCHADFPSCTNRIESRDSGERGKCALSLNLNKHDSIHSSQDNALQILRERYAKGEISEEEFERKMTNLKKHGLVK